MKRLLIAFGIGAALSLTLFWLGWVAVESGRAEISYWLYWQGLWLQTFVPCDAYLIVNLQLCRETAFSRWMFYGGIPLGAVIYGCVVYLVWDGWLRLMSRRT